MLGTGQLKILALQGEGNWQSFAEAGEGRSHLKEERKLAGTSVAAMYFSGVGWDRKRPFKCHRRKYPRWKAVKSLSLLHKSMVSSRSEKWGSWSLGSRAAFHCYCH